LRIADFNKMAHFSLTRCFIIKGMLLFIIKAYQFVVSPMLGDRCRFYPSCSDYAYQAIERYGMFKGLCISLKRILRCHPFNPGGFDPVP